MERCRAPFGGAKHVADGIQRDYRRTERQKRAAILWWMKNSATASWKELADALLKADYPILATRVMLNQGNVIYIIGCG